MIQFNCEEIPSINSLDAYINDTITYKAITELLELKYTTGNAKIKQLDIIQQYYQMEKDKRKFKIVRKYEEPCLIEDKRKSIYYDDLEIVLLHALNNNNCYDTWSISRALLIATLTNKNYAIGKRDLKLTAGALEVDENYLYDFYNTSFTRLKRIFESALNRMQSKKLIQYNTCIMICRRVTKIEVNRLGDPAIDDTGHIKYKVYEVYQEANTDERELILKAENIVLEALGYNDIQDVILKRKYDVFKKQVNKILKTEANILYYYNAYSIVKYNKKIASEISSLENLLCSAHLNDLKVNSFKDSNDKKMNRNLEDKEILIDYLLDNTCHLDLTDIIHNYNSIQGQQCDNSNIDMLDGIPF